MPLPSTIPVSVSELTTLLAQRLGIGLTGTDYWGTGELDYHVRNAIREFQVLTGYWRSRVSLSTAANTSFYDLHAALVPRTVYDTDILAQVGYHLLEYSGSGSYITTSQFAIAAVGAALGEWIDWMLGETRLVVTDVEGISETAGAGRITLDPSIVQVHRVEWKDTPSGLWTLLDRTDDIGAYGWDTGWPASPAIPSAYAQSTTPPLALDLIPASSAAGTLSMLATVSQGYSYSAGSPVTLQLPDDATWALVWAVLGAVLGQDAQSRDSQRADYAAGRLRAALGVLKSFPCCMQAWPAGTQQIPSSLFDLDHWRSGWRNAAAGTPQTVAVGGRNLLAVSPTPNAVYSISLDLVGNSPASVASRTATFAVANDIVTALLDHAQHEACFKMGGAEFQGTMGLYRSFVGVAQAYASRHRAETVDWEELRGVTLIENKQQPYEAVAEKADTE